MDLQCNVISLLRAKQRVIIYYEFLGKSFHKNVSISILK